MAEPGEPKSNDQDLDAEIGFCTPESLKAQAAQPATADNKATDAEVTTGPAVMHEADMELFAPPEPAPFAPEPAVFEAAVSQDNVAAATAGVPMNRIRARLTESDEPRRKAPVGLYAIYMLVLLALPTFGVSVLIGLLAMYRRELPKDKMEASHFIYLKRTMWAATVAILLGGVLVVVNIGVFVVFLAAVWILVRGTYGVLKLKANAAIPNPKSWLL